MEALRCLKRRLSDVVYRQLVADAEAANADTTSRRDREGTRGRLHNPARPTCPPREGRVARIEVFQVAAREPPCSEDLDTCLRTDAPAPSTPSPGKGYIRLESSVRTLES